MTVSTTTRLGITRWSSDNDAFTRDQLDTSHANLEARVAGGLSGPTADRPVASAAYNRTFYADTDLHTLQYCDGTQWITVFTGSAAPLLSSLADAKGDLLVGLADNSIDRLGVGSNGKVLTADSAQTSGLAWATPVLPSLIDAKGDLVAGSAPDTVVRLPVGADGKVLAADASTTSGLAWITPPSDSGSALTTKGDLLARSASAIVRLGVGANGKVLTADSSATSGLAWADVPLDSTKMPTAGGTFSGAVDMAKFELRNAQLKAYVETIVALSGGGAKTLNLDSGNVYKHTGINSAITYTIAHTLAADEAGTITLSIVFGGTVYAITWPAEVHWPGGVAPTFQANTRNLITLTTSDQGTNWDASALLALA